MTSDYVFIDSFRHLLAALMPENRLALEVSLATGLRIGDVLELRTDQVRAERFTVRERKTGKTRRLRLARPLVDELLKIAGKIFVFENRLDYRKPRTRQAVYKDLKRAAKLFRMPAGLTVSPHTARKVYAVGQFQRTCDLSRVKELLNHSDESVTMLYAMADVLTERRLHPSRATKKGGA